MGQEAHATRPELLEQPPSADLEAWRGGAPVDLDGRGSLDPVSSSTPGPPALASFGTEATPAPSFLARVTKGKEHPRVAGQLLCRRWVGNTAAAIPRLRCISGKWLKSSNEAVRNGVIAREAPRAESRQTDGPGDRKKPAEQQSLHQKSCGYERAARHKDWTETPAKSAPEAAGWRKAAVGRPRQATEHAVSAKACTCRFSR